MSISLARLSRPGVLKELRGLRVVRNAADDVEINAAHELLVIAAGIETGDRLLAEFGALRIGTHKALATRRSTAADAWATVVARLASITGWSEGFMAFCQRLILRRQVRQREACAWRRLRFAG
jgi:hypothetical protein